MESPAFLIQYVNKITFIIYCLVRSKIKMCNFRFLPILEKCLLYKNVEILDIQCWLIA